MRNITVILFALFALGLQAAEPVKIEMTAEGAMSALRAAGYKDTQFVNLRHPDGRRVQKEELRNLSGDFWLDLDEEVDQKLVAEYLAYEQFRIGGTVQTACAPVSAESGAAMAQYQESEKAAGQKRASAPVQQGSSPLRERRGPPPFRSTIDYSSPRSSLHEPLSFMHRLGLWTGLYYWKPGMTPVYTHDWGDKVEYHYPDGERLIYHKSDPVFRMEAGNQGATVPSIRKGAKPVLNVRLIFLIFMVLLILGYFVCMVYVVAESRWDPYGHHRHRRRTMFKRFAWEVGQIPGDIKFILGNFRLIRQYRFWLAGRKADAVALIE